MTLDRQRTDQLPYAVLLSDRSFCATTFSKRLSCYCHSVTRLVRPGTGLQTEFVAGAAQRSAETS
jgi:hypothetical protein